MYICVLISLRCHALKLAARDFYLCRFEMIYLRDNSILFMLIFGVNSPNGLRYIDKQNNGVLSFIKGCICWSDYGTVPQPGSQLTVIIRDQDGPSGAWNICRWDKQPVESANGENRTPLHFSPDGPTSKCLKKDLTKHRVYLCELAGRNLFASVQRCWNCVFLCKMNVTLNASFKGDFATFIAYVLYLSHDIIKRFL